MLGGGEEVAGQTRRASRTAPDVVVDLVGESLVGINQLVDLLLKVGDCLVKVVVPPGVGLSVARSS